MSHKIPLSREESNILFVLQMNPVRFNMEYPEIKHVEGGWPRDGNSLDPDRTPRFRKKTDKEDEYGRVMHGVMFTESVFACHTTLLTIDRVLLECD